MTNNTDTYYVVKVFEEDADPCDEVECKYYKTVADVSKAVTKIFELYTNVESVLVKPRTFNDPEML